MTSDTEPVANSSVLLSGYEELRDEALRRAGGPGRGSGLALFIRRGMAAWLAAYAPLARSIESHNRLPVAQDRVPPNLRTEVTMVLAEMALAAAGGVATC
jgi:hypothetical protein